MFSLSLSRYITESWGTNFISTRLIAREDLIALKGKKCLVG
jgi:hypothetical protein